MLHLLGIDIGADLTIRSPDIAADVIFVTGSYEQANDLPGHLIPGGFPDALGVIVGFLHKGYGDGISDGDLGILVYNQPKAMLGNVLEENMIKAAIISNVGGSYLIHGKAKFHPAVVDVGVCTGK